MSNSRHILYFFLLIGLLSCQKENMGDCFKSTGKIVEETRIIEPFLDLEIRDRIDVFVSQSSETSIRVKAGKNLQDLILTEVRDGKLIIENTNKCNWVRSYKPRIEVYLSTPDLTNIAYFGSGKVVFEDTLVTDQFFVELWESSGSLNFKVNANLVELKSNTGTATIYCEGVSNEFVSFMGGNGFIDSQNTICQKVLAVSENTGNLMVNAQSQLKAEIKSTGNISYVGNPVIELIDLGRGKLIKDD